MVTTGRFANARFRFDFIVNDIAVQIECNETAAARIVGKPFPYGPARETLGYSDESFLDDLDAKFRAWAATLESVQ